VIQLELLLQYANTLSHLCARSSKREKERWERKEERGRNRE